MALSVKNKIWYGTSFLFLLLILTGGTGIYFTAKLKQEARAVLKDNYESLSYCHIMQQNLDSLTINHKIATGRFEQALILQEKNITEPGELTATEQLRADWDVLANGDTSSEKIRRTEKDLQQILALNMQAIHDKDLKAEKTAHNAVTIIITLAGIVFIIAFTFSVNFPTIVTGPIRLFGEAIKEISNKNYKHRIYLDNKDEFGKLADGFNSMAERLEYFENSNLNKLLFEKNRAESVINSLKEASIGIDKNNVILFANYQALQLLGLKQQDVVGQTVETLSQKNDLFGFLVEESSTAPFKIVVENRENYFTKELLEVHQPEGSSKVIVVKNITSFKELDTAKTNFIATVSHELKTPLASSDFTLKLLEDERIGTLTAEQKELVQSLQQDNQRILKIISELLNMSQVETGKIQLNIQQVAPSQIVNSALETIAVNAKEKNITINTSIPPDLPLIKADAEKTTWVLNNILANAIRYSGNNTEVSLQLIPMNGQLKFSIKDQGPGIAPEYADRVFERYFQVPGTTKGTGLGLAISKDFIEAQAGSIGMQSSPDNGAEFYFFLPVAD